MREKKNLFTEKVF